MIIADSVQRTRDKQVFIFNVLYCLHYGLSEDKYHYTSQRGGM